MSAKPLPDEGAFAIQKANEPARLHYGGPSLVTWPDAEFVTIAWIDLASGDRFDAYVDDAGLVRVR